MWKMTTTENVKQAQRQSLPLDKLIHVLTLYVTNWRSATRRLASDLIAFQGCSQYTIKSYSYDDDYYDDDDDDDGDDDEDDDEDDDDNDNDAQSKAWRPT